MTKNEENVAILLLSPIEFGVVVNVIADVASVAERAIVYTVIDKVEAI
jgi:hypothetical protein